MNNTEKRNELVKRFLTKDKIVIVESDYDFLFNFETYKKAILENTDKELLFVDNGKMFNVSWCIYYEYNNCYYSVSNTLENSTVSSKIVELYPYSDEELEEIEKERIEKYNKSIWGKINNSYDIKVIKGYSDFSGITLFEIGKRQYYFAHKSKKIRVKGDKTWYTGVLKILNNNHSNNITEDKENKTTKDKENKTTKEYTPTDKAPGKHKEKTWLEVKEQDPSYIKWMIGATKDINLKKMLMLL